MKPYKEGKHLINNGELKGGLSKCSNIYRLFYLEKNPEYPVDKISLELLMQDPTKEQKDLKPRSLRFNNTEELRKFIKDVTEAYIIFMKKRDMINQENFNYKIEMLLRELRTVMMDTLIAKKYEVLK
jgi:hypothetical protein